ncbi:MAG TPA: polyphenol oxidase family protein [Phycisphaerae bacterium]|nr:polyphenol oxidase family protein [Phycisphaerae bacterium]HRY68996.1 polyphenol oxidase family protein [Phycisphaerae bacterium]HSA26030.1 polyphenol oxidase family protein [Phycisphaerae bacterium]
MLQTTHGDLTLLHFPRLARETGLAHAITTKPQNYAPHRGNDREAALDARRRVCRILGLEYDRLTSPEQVHGGEVVAVENADIGRGRDGRGTAVRYVDGLLCDRPGVPLILLSADCPLICVYDPRRRAAGAVHASWQGTVAHATVNLVAQMTRLFGCDPTRLLAAISPSAGPCCYEVGHDVRRIAQGKLDHADTFFTPRNDRFLFDLWSANHAQLTASGVHPDNIEIAGLCSICDHHFWSHRRDGADAGRSALFLALRDR